MSVERILVTGNNDQLEQFHLDSKAANLIERREQTVFYTVMDEDMDAILKAAKEAGVTVQKWAGQDPWWPVVIQGSAEAWKPKQK